MIFNHTHTLHTHTPHTLHTKVTHTLSHTHTHTHDIHAVMLLYLK